MRPELLEAARLLRENEPNSVEKAIGLLQGTVYAFSMKVCGHTEDAEDTSQEVMVRSLPHLAKVNEPKALAVWLYTVARNHCWRMRRKGANAPARLLSLDELMPDESELALLLQDAAATPEMEAMEGEHHRLLHMAVLSIPPQYRIVLVLHDMEDLDTDQIAEVLGIQVGTVRVRLHRARLYVRKQMSQLLRSTGPSEKSTKSVRQGLSAKAVTRRPLECRTLFANLSEYLDGRVEARSCDEMRGHIEACPACVAFIRDLRQAIDRCRDLKVSCDPEVAMRLRTVLTGEYLRMLRSPA